MNLKYFECSEVLEYYNCVKCRFKSSCKSLLNIHTCGAPTTLNKLCNCKWSTNSDFMWFDHFYNCADTLGGKWYQCEQCVFQTRNKRKLRDHTTVRHTSYKPNKWVSCFICAKKYRHKTNLRKHLNVKHKLQIKWFSCEQCDFTCQDRPALKKHRVLKHPQLWFCDYCSYTAKAKAHIRLHTNLRHVPDEQVNWWFCNLCNYKCKEKCYLVRHKSVNHQPKKPRKPSER